MTEEERKFATVGDVLRWATRLPLLPPGDDRAAVPAALAEVNWNHVLWLGRSNRVLLHLIAALERTGVIGDCPSDVVAQLHDYRSVIRLGVMARARDACLVQDLLGEHGIPVIPIDAWGSALGVSAMRDLVEIDSWLAFLVPPQEKDRAHKLLLKAGHPVALDSGRLFKGDSRPVLLNSGLARHVDAARFWNRSRMFEVGGREMRGLSVGHGLLLRFPSLVSPDTVTLAQAFEIVARWRAITPDIWSEMWADATALDCTMQLLTAIREGHRKLQLPVPRRWSADGADPPVSRPESVVNEAVARLPVAPFWPTPVRVMRRMLEFAGTGSEDIVFDLGCGDGRIPIFAAQHFGARGVGIDLAPVRIEEANANASRKNLGNRVKFVCADIFSVHLAEATIVCLYLLPSFYPTLAEHFRSRLRPGTRIVSHDYFFPGWAPEKSEIVRTAPLKVSQIYLWRMPGESSPTGS